MKIIKQIFIILLFYIVGESIALFIRWILPSFYIPGTIIGLLVFLIFLTTRRIKLKDVDEVGTFLTSNMAFFFIPAAVSVLEYFDILKSSIGKIIILIVISIVISLLAIVGSVKLTLYLQRKYKNKEEI